MTKVITLYTTHCPKCVILSKKLTQKNITFKENEDIGVMQEKGIMSLPVLEVDDVLMNFMQAVAWVNAQEDNN